MWFRWKFSRKTAAEKIIRRAPGLSYIFVDVRLLPFNMVDILMAVKNTFQWQNHKVAHFLKVWRFWRPQRVIWFYWASGDLSVGFGNLLNHFVSLPARIPLHLFVLNNVNHIQITSSITNVSFDPSFYSRKIFLVTLATQVNQQTLIGWKSHDQITLKWWWLYETVWRVVVRLSAVIIAN